MDMKTLLGSIGSTEPSTFHEMCNELKGAGEMPSDSQEWSSFFRSIEAAETQGWVEVERTQGKIDTVQLTEAGVAHLKTLR